MFLIIQNHSLISSLVRKTIYLNCNFMAIPKVPHIFDFGKQCNEYLP